CQGVIYVLTVLHTYTRMLFDGTFQDYFGGFPVLYGIYVGFLDVEIYLFRFGEFSAYLFGHFPFNITFQFLIAQDPIHIKIRGPKDGLPIQIRSPGTKTMVIVSKINDRKSRFIVQDPRTPPDHLVI